MSNSNQIFKILFQFLLGFRKSDSKRLLNWVRIVPPLTFQSSPARMIASKIAHSQLQFYLDQYNVMSMQNCKMQRKLLTRQLWKSQFYGIMSKLLVGNTILQEVKLLTEITILFDSLITFQTKFMLGNYHLGTNIQ